MSDITVKGGRTRRADSAQWRRVEDRHHPHHDDDDRYRYGEARYPDYRKKKRKDFLSDLFDF